MKHHLEDVQRIWLRPSLLRLLQRWRQRWQQQPLRPQLAPHVCCDAADPVHVGLHGERHRGVRRCDAGDMLLCADEGIPFVQRASLQEVLLHTCRIVLR
jgi:hypothetical protein